MRQPRRASVMAAAVLVLAGVAPAEDWPDWRGPLRDGHSAEKGLPENAGPRPGRTWPGRRPTAARSTPVVAGRPRLPHEWRRSRARRCRSAWSRLDAETGKVLWEYRCNVYHSDVPPHRVGWASPVVDRDTGNVYAFGVGGTLLGLNRDGKRLWERSLAEEFGLVTTHGGRTVSPVIEGDLVIVSGVTAGWGAQARAGHRFMAFDKKTGDTVWVSSPGGRPYDTTYSPPDRGRRRRHAPADRGRQRRRRARDQARRPGEPVWRYEVSKRGLNTGALVHGDTAIVTHSEENLDSSEMGLMAAIDATAKGDRQGAGEVAGGGLAGRVLLARARRRPHLPGG